MGEVIQIQIGQAGHRIGYSFWEELVREHHLDNTGAVTEPNDDHSKRHVFFHEQSQNIYRARSIFADMDSHSIDNIHQSQLSPIFAYENSCYDFIGTGNLWPVGYYAGKVVKQNVFDSIRKEVQKCDRLCGFNVVHSISGGSGSGLGSAILQNLQNQFPSEIAIPITGGPSPTHSNIVVEPYNALLAFDKLNSPCILFQNQALLKISKKRVPQSRGTFSEMNKLLAVALANMTSPFRFPCDGNVSWKKMACNLLQYPTHKFLTMSLPYECLMSKNKVGCFIKHQMLAEENWSVSTGKKIQKRFLYHKWVANYFVFRGQGWSSFDINYRIGLQFNKIVRNHRNKAWKDERIVRQISHSYLTSVVKAAPHRPGDVVTSIQNSSMVRQYLTLIHEKSSKMLQKKAYLHWFASEGTEIDQLNQVQSSLLDTLSYYQQMVQEPECYEEQHYEYE